MAYETVHALTSLPTHVAGPAEIGGLIRGHWGIENGLHWRRDVTWNEDRSQVRKDNAPQVMAMLRNIAITLLKRRGYRNLARATRKLRNQSETVLAMVGLVAAHRLCMRPVPHTPSFLKSNMSFKSF
ncbi:transposase [Glutamicibacter protophormiae]|uniref:transposase n=1 Tax=Glutamicibacter protophormiae TaxID=37930 RepID=UPI00389A0EF7